MALVCYRFETSEFSDGQFKSPTGAGTVIDIDGAIGEGGGQIVRSSLALSAVTGTPVTIYNIRARRSQPGLRKQHQLAVTALAEVCQAQVEGAAVGSRAVTFTPGKIIPRQFHFDVQSAGSTTLIFQTLLPALLCANGPSEVILEGGTHNPWAPPVDFLQRCYLPLIAKMGPKVSARLEKYGFYPAGGGKVTFQIQPSPLLAGFDLLEAGKEVSRQATILTAHLPDHVAEREAKTISQHGRGWTPKNVLVQSVPSAGPGNVVFLEFQFEHITEIFTSFGRKGVRAERVANDALKEATSYLEAQVPVGPHLADQLLLPLALSAAQPQTVDGQEGGSFLTMPLTQHSLTHIEIIRRFLDVNFTVETLSDLACRVTVSPK